MMKIAKRYRFFFILAGLNLALLVINPSLGQKSFSITWNNVLEMLSVLPPIFVMLGLLDVWVEREAMIKLMGEKSGIMGPGLAFLLGSAAAGPLYAAFPIAGILLKKGSKLSNVLIFIGAWATTKIPQLLFEASAMGVDFMMARFVINLPVIALIAYATEKMLSDSDKAQIYESAEGLQ